ncbi:MAG TPA: hypothetical protein VL001_02820 [Candidimonas sp.]|nr:hypothetical protein [Candidimonas sp.]
MPVKSDWRQLKLDIQKYGLYNQNLQAVPPTGSISYVNGSTSFAANQPIFSSIRISPSLRPICRRTITASSSRRSKL